MLKQDIRETELRLLESIKGVDLQIEQTRAELTREIEFLRSDLKKDIEMLRLEMQKNTSDAKAELIRWVVGMGLLQSSLIIGVLMKIAHWLCNACGPPLQRAASALSPQRSNKKNPPPSR